MLRATTACTFSASQRPKMVRTWCAFNILTSKCASATTACAFSTSQLPKVVHFDFEMCFAPQPRDLFDIATSKVVQTRCVLYILTSKCASRHNGVHFFDISTVPTVKSGPDLVCFVHFDFEICFAPHRCAIFHLSSGQLAPHPPL